MSLEKVGDVYLLTSDDRLMKRTSSRAGLRLPGHLGRERRSRRREWKGLLACKSPASRALALITYNNLYRLLLVGEVAIGQVAICIIAIDSIE